MRYTTKYASFVAMSYKKFKNEPRFIWSYWIKVHEIFTQYIGIIYALNAHIQVAISHSVSECQSYKCRRVGNFATKLVAMATSLEESEKTRPDREHSFPFGEKIVKIGPVDPEIALLIVKKEEITECKIYSPVGNLAICLQIGKYLKIGSL